MDQMMLLEALASVALSHEPDCVCDVCQAAQGDGPALERAMVQYAAARAALGLDDELDPR